MSHRIGGDEDDTQICEETETTVKTTDGCREKDWLGVK